MMWTNDKDRKDAIACVQGVAALFALVGLLIADKERVLDFGAQVAGAWEFGDAMAAEFVSRVEKITGEETKSGG